MPSKTPSHAEIDAAWRKARPIGGHDPAQYRLAPDILQSVIRRDRFGVCGKHGWRIEHGRPVSWHEMSMETAMRQLAREFANPAGGPRKSRLAR